MLPEMIPIGKTEFNIPKIYATFKEALGRSISSLIDTNGVDANTLMGLLSALEDARSPQTTFTKLSGHAAVLNHVSYSLLLVAKLETAYKITTTSNLWFHDSVCSNGLELCVVTGTLSCWRESVIRGTSKTSDTDVRRFFDKCLIYFEKEGFGQIWSDYRKEIK
jgi:hypothetical protein